MSDSHETFKALERLAASGFSSTALAGDVSPVNRRVRRQRQGRAALITCAGAACVWAIAAVFSGGFPGLLGETPPATRQLVLSTREAQSIPTPTTTASAAPDDPACPPAETEAGIPALGFYGGAEGWWSSVPHASCEEWPEAALEHPDTVLVNTLNNTMVEGYFRTGDDAIEPYRALGPEFIVEPGPEGWPANKLVLIDAHTRELLEVLDMPSEDLNPANAVPYIP